MRTIIVIFTDKKVSFNEAASYKRYKLSSSMALGRKL